ncbi:MAG: NAD-dependent deacetylase [Gammaproteobacteria bacterium RIFCSPLOWO2_12_FULL_52_10]|nr:MAG: NAD-dependent deacetylase [Gammaproteobacteria bacterium RIFCSPLOWO2_12_FULL_52_10]
MQELTERFDHRAISDLLNFIESNQPLVILTGAGCSTDSGIPDYRDRAGRWKHRQPVLYMDFIRRPDIRKRYWSRSMLGWPRIAQANPNATHTALVVLEHTGLIRYLVTQNVDGLHQKAGSKSLLELHGGLAWAICLECQHRFPRAEVQDILLQDNPDLNYVVNIFTPDGDAHIENHDLSSFRIPACPACRGILKPDVVFFGEPVPKHRIDRVMIELDQAKALLIIGSSLMVYSGYRFCRYVKKQNKSVAILNQGRTRADGEVDLKIELPCHTVLPELTRQLFSNH